MRRRTFLAATAGTAATAGCLDALGVRTQSAWRDPPLVEDRPEAVYYPAIVEGMGTYGTKTVGPYTVGLMYSYPHRFWTVTGSQREKTVVGTDDSLHLMATVWDDRSGVVVPADGGLSAEVTRDGELVAQEVIYPMLSQRMGFHYGANVALPGDGTYTAAVSVGGAGASRTRGFAGGFDGPATATFEVGFAAADLADLSVTRLSERAGERGAVEPMDADSVPVGRAPPTEALPGTPIGTKRSGGAVFPVRAMPNTDDGGTRLAAFPRTPYNRVVLPFMSLSATVRRNGRRLPDEELRSTLDAAAGHHYATTVDDLRPGDEVVLSVGTPPQIARHDGYETTFLDDMATMRFSVPAAV